MSIGRVEKTKSIALLPAQGIYELHTNVPFRILETQCLKNPVAIHEHIGIAMGKEASE